MHLVEIELAHLVFDQIVGAELSRHLVLDSLVECSLYIFIWKCESWTGVLQKKKSSKQSSSQVDNSNIYLLASQSHRWISYRRLCLCSPCGLTGARSLGRCLVMMTEVVSPSVPIRTSRSTLEPMTIGSCLMAVRWRRSLAAGRMVTTLFHWPLLSWQRQQK